MSAPTTFAKPPPAPPHGNLLEALPPHVLSAVLGKLEEQGQNWEPGCPPEANQLLPLPLVSKGLCRAVDESLSYLTFNCRRERDVPLGHTMATHSLLLFRSLPRWPALRHLVLSVNWPTALSLQFALSLAAATCPALERLDIKDDSHAHTDAPGSIDFRVLSGLTRLHTLGVYWFEAPFLSNLGALESVSTLELYDVFEHGRLATGGGLERLVLCRSEREFERWPETNVEVELVLQASQSLESMRLEGYRVSVALLPDSLTSLSLRNVRITGSPVLPVKLPKLVELELVQLILEQRVNPELFKIHLPTTLMSLKLCSIASTSQLPVVRLLDTLPTLKHLQLLHLQGLPDFDHLPDLSGCSDITSLVLDRLDRLTCVQALSALVSLQTLEVKTCQIVTFPALGTLGKLTKLCLWDLVLEHPLDLRPLTLLVHLEHLRGNDFPIVDGLEYLKLIYYEPNKARDKLLLPQLPQLERVVLGGPWPFEVEAFGPGVSLEYCFEV